MKNQHYPFVNLPLPYEYDGLEPYIDAKTMMLHHDKHLQGYINNLNTILKENPGLQRLSLNQLIQASSKLPLELQAPIRNNAGGVYNHRFYFEGLTPKSTSTPSGVLLEEINRSFKSYESFKTEFKKSALSVFGSGYTWLLFYKGKLAITTTKNQNSPIEHNLTPILTLDLWEHAYYLKHYNLRSDYIDNWFHLINWPQSLA